MEPDQVKQDAEYVQRSIEEHLSEILQGRRAQIKPRFFSHYDVGPYAGNIFPNRIERACDELAREGVLESKELDRSHHLHIYRLRKSSFK